MYTINYNLYSKEINLKEIKINIPIVYEIIKKYVTSIKLENM